MKSWLLILFDFFSFNTDFNKRSVGNIQPYNSICQLTLNLYGHFKSKIKITFICLASVYHLHLKYKWKFDSVSLNKLKKRSYKISFNFVSLCKHAFNCFIRSLTVDTMDLSHVCCEIQRILITRSLNWIESLNVNDINWNHRTLYCQSWKRSLDLTFINKFSFI